MTTQTSLLDDGHVDDVDIADRMESAFLDYSMSVIVGRALPDVRDGLKPVQRRILHAMNEAGLRADRQQRKCASVVGDVMKKYHPHGDTAIYDALVRMAQDFAIREPLVDGRGNFGSVDGDPAAAMRYTECKLSPVAMEMLVGIDEETVDFVPNYDGFEVEPTVLPSRFPNLLVNGATGIAVGMATNIPPHNLRETIAACRLLMRNPDATLDEVMEVLPAPDFPTGSRIMPGDGIREAYETGRGAIVCEALAATETRSGGLPRIVITEIPYQVNKSSLLTKMADLVKAKKLDGIRDLRDESSMSGMRVVIELKRGEDPAKTLDRLYKLTELRSTFHVNFVALDSGRPRTLGLVEALHLYLAHQRQVLTRRTSFRLERALARLHVLEGLLIALDNLDAVIALIRAADSAAVARTQLMERFAMSEIQANAVLDMQLRRLARLEADKILAEHEELQQIISSLEAILGDPAQLDRVLAEELEAIAATHGNERRSRLVGVTGEDGTPDQGGLEPVLAAQEVTTYVTAGGYVKAVARKRISAPHNAAHDPAVAVLRAAADDHLLLIDEQGGGYRIDSAELGVVSMRVRGTQVAAILGDPPEAPIAGAVVLGHGTYVLTVSAGGYVKRSASEEYEGRLRAMAAAGVKDGDRIVQVLVCEEDDELLLAHSGGQLIRFPVADVRAMGRTAAGVAGLKLPKGREIVAASVVPEGAEILVLSADGAAKRVAVSDIPGQGRGGKGVLSGASSLAWAGACRMLHVPNADDWTVLRPETVEKLARSRAPQPAVPAVTGRPVAEDMADDED